MTWQFQLERDSKDIEVCKIRMKRKVCEVRYKICREKKRGKKRRKGGREIEIDRYRGRKKKGGVGGGRKESKRERERERET